MTSAQEGTPASQELAAALAQLQQSTEATSKSAEDANKMVAILVQLKERAEAAAKSTEEANSKANSEAGFAFNAKQYAEEHAKAISQVRGTVDADSTWLATTKKNAEEAAQTIAAAKAASEADSRVAADAKASAEKESAAAKAASDGASAGLKVVEKAQADTTAALASVNSSAAATSAAKATAETNAKALQDLQAKAVEMAAKANADAAAIAKAEGESKTLMASLEKVIATASATHERVETYQKDLGDLTKSFQAMHSKIEGLLPNATSAGLASAFRNQKSRFANPQRNWLNTFVFSILALLAVGLVGLPWGADQSWDVILRHLVQRLPLVLPLVWLAIYAGRHYNLALRVEEEYAFKEAVSTAFEGYEREMAGIKQDGADTAMPLITLCQSVLQLLAERPGKIYEGRQQDITPMTSLAKTLEDVAKTMGELKKGADVIKKVGE